MPESRIISCPLLDDTFLERQLREVSFAWACENPECQTEIEVSFEKLKLKVESVPHTGLLCPRCSVAIMHMHDNPVITLNIL